MQKMEDYFKELDCEYIMVDIFAYNGEIIIVPSFTEKIVVYDIEKRNIVNYILLIVRNNLILQQNCLNHYNQHQTDYRNLLRP